MRALPRSEEPCPAAEAGTSGCAARCGGGVIALENVSKRYGEHAALVATTFSFGVGRTTALIGASGCGKSTLLRLITGLIAPSTGRVLVNGEPLNEENLNRIRHGIGYVIQEGGLFPHLTAHDNVALLARHLERSSRWIGERVSELAELVQLPTALLGRFPQHLSGGQRQRVSLMRALMLDPPILLLDEPLAALDAMTRWELQEQFKRVFASLRKTVVFVTHDIAEAAYLGDEIAVMREGAILQCGSFDALLHEPADPYVSRLVLAQRSLARGLP